MGKASRDKGKRGERDARNFVRKEWQAPNCIRSAQVSGSFSSDVMYGPDGIHIEVKFYKRIAACRWMEQAEEDAKEGEVPMVMFRENGGQWYVAMPFDKTVQFTELLQAHLGGKF